MDESKRRRYKCVSIARSFIRLAGRRVEVRDRPIVISEADASRLRGLLRARVDAALRDQGHLRELKSELERALVVEAAEIPPDVITVNSRAWVVDLESYDRREYVLVLPAEADPAAGRISVLAPLGTALLGYREGDDVEWVMPGGLRRLRIEAVFQPRPVHAGNESSRATALEAVGA